MTALVENNWLERFQNNESGRLRRQRRTRVIDKIVLFIALIMVWQGAVSVGLVNTFFTSSPFLISEDLGTLLTTPSFYGDIGITLGNALIGLFIGAVLGVSLGLFFALSPRMGAAIQPLLVAFNSLPRVALAPLFVVWLGLGPPSKILLAAFTVFFLIFFNVLSGVRQVDPSLVWNLRVLELSRSAIVRTIYLPSAGIWLVAALKTAISLGVTAAVVGEFVGSNAGLGNEMTTAIALLNTTRMFSVLVVLMAIGLCLFGIVSMIERRLLRWQ